MKKFILFVMFLSCTALADSGPLDDCTLGMLKVNEAFRNSNAANSNGQINACVTEYAGAAGNSMVLMGKTPSTLQGENERAAGSFTAAFAKFKAAGAVAQTLATSLQSKQVAADKSGCGVTQAEVDKLNTSLKDVNDAGADMELAYKKFSEAEYAFNTKVMKNPNPRPRTPNCANTSANMKVISYLYGKADKTCAKIIQDTFNVEKGLSPTVNSLNAVVKSCASQ